ncbi:MAG TPA: SLOG family protein [Nostocaceae cyanobacterium]|nr:SLOG family protein [Nostocaceae cyanobacterium]
MIKASFTGHRCFDWETFKHYQRGAAKLIDFASMNGWNIELFINGMALGGDMAAARVLVGRSLPWKAVIPFKGQHTRWSQGWRTEYKQILACCPEITVLYPKYVDGCLPARNQEMINQSDLCLAIWDGKNTGGTAMTVNMAIKAKIPVIQWNPVSDEISVIVHQPNNHQQLTLNF